MKPMNHWRECLILIAVVAFFSGTILLGYVVTVEKIKTQGIAIIELNLPKIVSRFDLGDIADKIPEAGSKIEEAASQIVDEVSAKATDISNLLGDIPNKVTLGMDEVCWYAPQMDCTPIWKGIDGWFPVPFEKFIKIEDPPIFLALIKVNIIRIATTASLVLCLLVILSFFVWPVWSWLKYRKEMAVRERKTSYLEYKKNKAVTEQEEILLIRLVIGTVVIVGNLILLPILLSLIVLHCIDDVLQKITIKEITRTPGKLSQFITCSLFLHILSMFITLFLVWKVRRSGAVRKE